jgi:hypothetical protein
MAFALVMALGTLLPYTTAELAAAPGDTASEPLALAQAGISNLEVDVVRCPDDFDPNDLFGTCTDFGVDGVSVQLTHSLPDVGYDVTQVTEAPDGGGPGRTTFEAIPEGEYAISFDLTVEDGYRTFLYCGVAGGGQPLPANPDDALDATITVPGDTNVACDLYFIPTEAPADPSTLDLSAFTCEAGALPDDGSREFSDFQAACTTEAPGVDFHLVTSDDTDTTQTTDQDGRAQFSFPSGSPVEFWADVELEEEEWLFCSVDQGEANEITMDDQGVAHFDNASAEARTCSWFLIEDAPEPTAEPTEAPTEEATQEPTAEPAEQPIAPPDENSQISVFPTVCPIDYTEDPASLTLDNLRADCDVSAQDVSFTFAYPNGDQDIRVADGANPLTFTNLAGGPYSLYSSVPLEAASERVFCTAGDGAYSELVLSDRAVAIFDNLEAAQVDCEWYIIPTNLRGEETGGSLEVHLSLCPEGYTGNTIFDDCHGNGLDGYEFTLEGEGGDFAATTEILQTPGPGIATFTGLPAGEYTLRGGPPGDFGSIELFCSIQPEGGEATWSIEGATGTVSIGENEHVLCDWYFIPENLSGLTPTPEPTEAPSRAEILVTLFSCPPTDSGTYGGASLGDLQDECTEKVNDVTFRLGDPDSAPLSAKTGVSGEGAVRFYDLLPGDYTMTPSMPSNLTSLAVFCTIDDGDPYQKALANGGTTFVNVDGESIACSWFAVEDRVEPAPQESGSITVREYLCEEKDRSAIEDWDKECTAGSSGVSFTLESSATGASQQGTPNEQGVHVFSGLADGFYNLTQDEGAWCRAVADRVDSQSRVIVEGGGNTDVVIYQCGAVEDLPVTGSGPGGTITGDSTSLSAAQWIAIGLAVMALPLAWFGFVQRRKRPVTDRRVVPEPLHGPIVSADGRTRMRFR